MDAIKAVRPRSFKINSGHNSRRRVYTPSEEKILNNEGLYSLRKAPYTAVLISGLLVVLLIVKFVGQDILDVEARKRASTS